MSLLLKSNVAYSGLASLNDGFAEYKQRVLADGGVIMDEEDTKAAFVLLNPLLKSNKIVSIINASWGIKLVDGKVLKIYSLTGEDYDFISRGTASMGVTSKTYNGRLALTTPGTFNLTYSLPSAIELPSNYGILLNHTGREQAISTLIVPALYIRKTGSSNSQQENLGAILFKNSLEDFKSDNSMVASSYLGSVSIVDEGVSYTTGLFELDDSGFTYYNNEFHLHEIPNNRSPQNVDVLLASTGKRDVISMGARGLYYGAAVTQNMNESEATRMAKIMSLYM